MLTHSKCATSGVLDFRSSILLFIYISTQSNACMCSTGRESFVQSQFFSPCQAVSWLQRGTLDISHHRHLAPGFSYDFSSCRSFVLPSVTLRPSIHTHKESLKSDLHKQLWNCLLYFKKQHFFMR